MDKPKYKTKSGREVHGGGGISPDVYVPLSKYTATITRLVGHPKRPTFNWGTDYAKGRKADWKDLIEFNRDFQITAELTENFLTYAKNQNVDFDRKELDKDISYLRSVLKAEVAGAIWGKSAYYQMFVSEDPQVTAALSHFDDAAKFLVHH